MSVWRDAHACRFLASFLRRAGDIYDLVLAAHDAGIEKVRAGVEYKHIHLLACQVIAQGLMDLGILRGRAEDWVEMDANALFFPHGIGHLLGLDVPNLEDFWDLAGYEEGGVRSERFGWGYLRRNLPCGMLRSSLNSINVRQF